MSAADAVPMHVASERIQCQMGRAAALSAESTVVSAMGNSSVSKAQLRECV